METLNIESLITDLALILTLGAISTIIFKKLKQPVVLGYIVAGFLASPHFALLPSVAIEANIEFWAQIGIIILLFSLGLECSFKKLLNVGGSAVITALIIVLGMMSVGFITGKVLNLSTINCLFLGGMLSMSSTTIIIKALSDLNMKTRKFVPGVFAVLIVEDLFAVVMMVLLSSVAINKSVDSGEMLWSILKLLFFLTVWFTVGVFVLPSLFNRLRTLISDELMLVIAMALCFMMAIFSVKSGFSMALGAFVMGSILAGTSKAEHIERVVEPVKDLFGAVFFISVGMMVNPQIIVQYWPTIALLSVVVVVGMIVFGTFGMLATGQPLKIAMESGFCLTQIGEFAFIIASLGMSLGVLDPTLYPIVVAVSVITTFFTPFFIKSAVPCYNRVERMLPSRLSTLLNGYSRGATQGEQPRSSKLWPAIVKRYLLRVLLYSVVTIALIIVVRTYYVPFMEHTPLGTRWGRLLAAVTALGGLSPFIFAIISPPVKSNELDKLLESSGTVSYVPIVVMLILSLIVAMALLMSLLAGLYSVPVSALVVVVIVALMALVFAPILRERISRIEKHFIGNVNERDLRRTGRNTNLVSDLHLAYIRVGQACPFAGEKLINADLRRTYGVNVVSIQRGMQRHLIPTKEMRILPGDIIGVVGNDDQIQRLLPIVEAQETEAPRQVGDVKFTHLTLSEQSPLIGKSLAQARLREDYSTLLIQLQRGPDTFISPTPELRFFPGDVIWVVGDTTKHEKLK